MTGDGVFAASVGIGHGIAGLVVGVVRGLVMAEGFTDVGGRSGWVAGDAFADGGLEFGEECAGDGAAPYDCDICGWGV